MAQCMTVYLFGDQSNDITGELRQLVCSNRNLLLDLFLTSSYDVLRLEISRTPCAQKVMPRFASLFDLIDFRRNGEANAPLDLALVTVYQFGLFFWKCHESGDLYPDPANTCLIGLCTGSLAVAAIFCCRTLSELLPVALQVVVLSYRAGALAADVGARIAPASERKSSSWALGCPSLSVDQAQLTIRAFSESEKLPAASRPYVSCNSVRGVTISGPPDSLWKLQTSDDIHHMTVIQLPVYAPYHAPHLYSSRDVELLFNEELLPFCTLPSRGFSMISGVTGEQIQAENLGFALRNALNEVFLKPMQLNLLAGALGPAVDFSKSTQITLIPISTAICPSIQAALSENGYTDVKVTSPQWKSFADITSATTASSSKSKIAIIAMSGRFPGARDISAFWDILYHGLDVHKVVPPLRWSDTHVDVSGTKKNTSATPFGCWLDDAEMFDARFFGMSPREAFQVDPAQRLALMTAYEAMEHGGIVPDSTPSTRRDRVGVFYGVTSNDWMETNSAQEIDTYFIPGGNRAFIAGRINYHFKFSGPSYVVDTACSSSLAAIHLACNSLWLKEVDTVIAGGTNILTNPDFTSGLDRGHFLSRTGNCKSFDDSADGYCRGEGVATVILKRLEDALIDNDPIEGVILNIRTKYSAESESITRPNTRAQETLFQDVLNYTSPSTISYVEMHGTGTQVGDATEMSSVLEIFAPSSGVNQRSEAQPLFLGSAKANVGHGEAAAGVTSLIKVLLMLQHNTIPPHCGIKTKINHKFPDNLSARNAHIADKVVKWDKSLQTPRRVLVNNFSAAGGNTVLLLEEIPARQSREAMKDSRRVQVIAVSAKTSSSLKANAKSLVKFLRLQRSESLSLSSLSYTTTARRIHHPFRISIVGSSVEEVDVQLSNAINRETKKTRPVSGPVIIFTFTGQGSHYIGMGKDLYEQISSFRNDINRYDRLTQSQGWPSIIGMITANNEHALDQSPVGIHLATTCLQMALVRLWKLWGIVPQSVIGHSLGHYAALYSSGVLSEADTIYLVGMRVQLIQNNCLPDTHLMLAVKAPASNIKAYINDQKVEVACINGPKDVILSGKRDDIESVQRALTSQKIRAITLRIPYAFHSSQMECVLDEFESNAKGVMFHRPSIPVICPLEKAMIRECGHFGSKHLADHLRRPVDMVGALEVAAAQGVVENTVFIEIGPHPTVSAMLREILDVQFKALPSLERNLETWKTIADVLSMCYMLGVDVNWKKYHEDFESCQNVLFLPSYDWDLSSYWIKYVNDWSLRKGDPALQDSLPGSSVGMGPRLLSTTIHSVASEKVGDEGGLIVVLSDLSRCDLHPIIQGHKVNGIPLCTPAMYADIAFSIGTYLRDKRRPNKGEQQISITNMMIQKALVVQPKGPQMLRTWFNIDWKDKRATCQFSSVDMSGSKIVDHAKCNVLFSLPPTSKWLDEKAAETLLQIRNLEEGLGTGTCWKFNRSMIYRMVGTLAEFDPEYRGLKEIVLDNSAMAASGKVEFSTIKQMKYADFHTHPAFIDAFSQLGGFVMNANESSDLEVEVFVNHGWGSLQIYEKICPCNTYRSCVRMSKKEASLWEGSLVVLNGGKVICRFEDLKLQGVPKKLLQSILSLANKEQSQNKPSRDSSSSRTTANTVSEGVGKEYTYQIMKNTDDMNLNCVSVVSEDLSTNIAKALSIIADESGIDEDELNDDTHFAAVGIDSLLSLIITNRLKDEIGFDTGTGSSVFDEFSTVGELRVALARSFGMTRLDISLPHSASSKASTAPSITNSSTPSGVAERAWEASTLLPSQSLDSKLHRHQEARQCSSVVLQGSPRDSSRILFLFPDGSGSAQSYTSIPPVSNQLAIIGLNCPYRRDPERMTCSLNALVTSYLAEIRRRQPTGPYSLGGWSSGGVFAYRATAQLIMEGETVQHLVLIDSPVPRGMDKLPQRFYEHCSAVGIFGLIGRNDGGAKKSPPQWLVPHFNATIDLLHDYYAGPLPTGVAVKVSLYWASECVLDGVSCAKLTPGPDDNEGMKFLTEKRSDFTAGGWLELFPDSEVHVVIAEGANHFSMMYGEKAKALGGFIALATNMNTGH